MLLGMLAFSKMKSCFSYEWIKSTTAYIKYCKSKWLFALVIKYEFSIVKQKRVLNMRMLGPATLKF